MWLAWLTQRFPGLSVLGHAHYARALAGRFCASLAWQMFTVAVGWQVYALTHDALALGFVGLSEFLPFVILVLFGGHVADRVDRRTVLIVAWSVDALCIGALLAVTVVGLRAVWPLYLAVGGYGAARAFWAPAMQAVVPSLVPRAEFPRAVAISSTLQQVAVISGPAIGGLLFLVGPVLVFGICCTLFVLAVAMALQLPARLALRAPGAARGSTPHELMEGLRYVRCHHSLLGVITLDLFAVLFGGAAALLPIFASDVLRIGPVGLGLLRSAPGVGAALAASLLALRPIERHAGAWMFGGVGLFGIGTLVFALSGSVAWSLAALFLCGCGDMVSVNIRSVLVQMNTPDAIRGRVSAINMMFIGASNELGEFESGVTARWFGAVRAAALGGALTLLVVGSWMRLFPELRRLDRLH
jgi:MFS family permease